MIVLSTIGIAATALLFQNCGQAFSPAQIQNATITSVDNGTTSGNTSGDPIVTTSGGGTSGGTTSGSTSGGTSGSSTGGTSGSTTGGGTTGVTVTPSITMGLQSRLMYSSPAGVAISIAVNKTAGTTYQWIVNGKVSNTASPQLLISDRGTVNVRVTATFSSGQSASSTATLLISNFALINNKLSYFNPATNKYEEVPGADMATTKLVGLNNAADATHLFTANPELAVFSVSGATAAVEISSTHVNINGVVYYRGLPIPGANAATFTSLGKNGYGKDNQKIYCQNAALDGANLATFAVPLSGLGTFAKDNTNLYSGCKVWMAHDPNTFSVISSDYVDPAGSKAFIKTGSKYFFIQLYPSSTMTAPLRVELPFVPTQPSKLKGFGEYLCCLVTDGEHFARTAFILASQVATPLTLTNISAPPSVDLDSFVYVTGLFYKDKNRVYVFKLDNTWAVVPNVDPATFVALDYYLLKDANHLYISNDPGVLTPVSTVANLASLTAVGYGVYRDNNQVYMSNAAGVLEVIPNANPATFSFIGGPLYKDANRIWLGGKDQKFKEINVDRDSVKSIGNLSTLLIYVDKNKIYLTAYSTVTKDWLQFEVATANSLDVKVVPYTYYFYTPSTLYFYGMVGGTPGIHIVNGVAPTNLLLFSNNTYSTLKSGTKIIQGGVWLTALDATKIAQQGGSNSHYWKDDNMVTWYYDSFIILSNKASSFRFIDATKSLDYATDGTTVWWYGRAIAVADPATFIVTSNFMAEDKNYRYIQDIPTHK